MLLLLPPTSRLSSAATAVFRRRAHQWRPAVGLEVHAQLQVASKLFSRAPAGDGGAVGGGVNGSVAPLDAAHPGSLPVLSGAALRAALTTALALNCSRVAGRSSFERKHYFYADMPLGYQITQSREPLAASGHLDFVCAGQQRRLRLRQVQLEQDSGKCLHHYPTAGDRGEDAAAATLVDLNRAGVALVELVFEADLVSGAEAAAVARELVQLLRTLGTCSCQLEQGGLRIDANVSVAPSGASTQGTRTELKNLNSVRSVARAVDFEIGRQVALLAAGTPVAGCTLAWTGSRSVPMRSKGQLDYRFLPEPSLPAVRVDAETVAAIAASLPATLPQRLRDRLAAAHPSLSLAQVAALVEASAADSGMLQLFTETMELLTGDRLATTVFRLLVDHVFPSVGAKRGRSQLRPAASAAAFVAQSAELLHEGLITWNHVDMALLLLETDSKEMRHLVAEQGWRRQRDAAAIEQACRAALGRMPGKSKAYRKKGSPFALEQLLLFIRTHSKGDIDDQDAKAVLDRLLCPPPTATTTTTTESHDEEEVQRRG